MIHILIDSDNKKGFVKIEGGSDDVLFETELMIDGILKNAEYATDFLEILEERLLAKKKSLEEELTELIEKYKMEDINKNDKNDSCD